MESACCWLSGHTVCVPAVQRNNHAGEFEGESVIVDDENRAQQ